MRDFHRISTLAKVLRASGIITADVIAKGTVTFKMIASNYVFMKMGIIEKFPIKGKFNNVAIYNFYSTNREYAAKCPGPPCSKKISKTGKNKTFNEKTKSKTGKTKPKIGKKISKILYS